MKSFTYVIKDEVGIHARPAGLLVQEAKKYDSKIVVKSKNKSAEATKLMALMSMGVKCNDTVEVEIIGGEEEQVCQAMKAFFEENF